MYRTLWRTMALAMCLGLMGCEKKAEQPSKPAAAPTAASPAPAPRTPPATQPPASSEAAKPTTITAKPAAAPADAGKRTVEAACGSCIFHMEGVSGCQLAVKIDGKPYLVTGADVDAHSAGLCSAAKQADVTGTVKDGKFAATSFALKN